MDITLYSPQAIMNLHIFMINENIFSYGMDSSTSGRRSINKNVSYPKNCECETHSNKTMLLWHIKHITVLYCRIKDYPK